MKKLCILTLASFFLALTVIAQENEKAKKEEMSYDPPKALNDDLLEWMVGEWQGWTEGPTGKSKEWHKFEFGLDKQFLIMKSTSEMPGMKYEGLGTITLKKDGTTVGYWFDNMRGIYKGEGKRQGDLITMKWTGPDGIMTRITEKAGNDKFKITAKMMGADGNLQVFTGEFTRTKDLTTQE